MAEGFSTEVDLLNYAVYKTTLLAGRNKLLLKLDWLSCGKVNNLRV